MSMKKNALATALVAGLSLAGVAAAYTIQTNNDDIPERVATADITSAATVITMTEAVNVEVDPLDFIVGRTTGFNVRVELSTGVFNANPTVNTAPGGAGSALPAGWTVTLVAGGANNTFAVFAVQPPSTTPVPAIQPGEVFNLTNVQLRGLTSLQTSGNFVTGVARFIDPVGASEIGSDTTVLLQSGNPVQLGCDPEAGTPAVRIDVGQSETQGSKTYFSSTGEIGALDEDTIDLGNVVVSRDSSFGSFAYTGTDSFTTVVTGDFSAFYAAGNNLYLSADNCATAITATEAYNDATGTATFTYTGANAGFTATGGTLALCGFVAPGNTTVIDASTVSVRTTFNRTGVPAVTGAACSLLPLQYNGSVVRVYNVNPAGNTTAQSFVRIINQSNTSGRVTIVGIDDNGVQRGPVTLNLDGLKSIQVNSEDLEGGNAAKGLTGSLGDGAGRWRLFVTGEFSGMVVQSLNRNTTDGTVTNLTDADTRGEQVLYDLFESTTGGPL
jgi:hypothetical protein